MIKFDRETPVLLLVFNRPELTNIIFETIKKAAPKYLYVAADGPRSAEESVITDAVRATFKNIDWDCTLTTLFQPTNLGCGKAVSEGISWFFTHVTEGIILEDDCLPNRSFFAFCSSLLAYYRNDERVGHISGSNFQDGIKRGDGSYYFSELTHVWGWASWRRVWKDYDFKIKSFTKMDTSFKEFPAHRKFNDQWKQIFEAVSTGQIDTWDYQYAFLNLEKGYKSVMPNVNLIVNIGLGVDSTHTCTNHPLAGNVSTELNELNHPTTFAQSVTADIYTQNKEFNTARKKKNIFSLIWRKIKFKFK